MVKKTENKTIPMEMPSPDHQENNGTLWGLALTSNDFSAVEQTVYPRAKRTIFLPEPSVYGTIPSTYGTTPSAYNTEPSVTAPSTPPVDGVGGSARAKLYTFLLRIL